MTTMTTPKPPKGRRWLKEGEIIRKWDRFHSAEPGLYGGLYHVWHLSRYVGQPVRGTHEYSRAIPRKTTRK